MKSKKEVIVSAGAVGSPHLLLLSGIGPKEELEKVNVQVLKDLQGNALPLFDLCEGVGKNLQDHMIIYLGFNTDMKSISKADKLVQLYELGRYILFKEGMMTTNVVEGTSNQLKLIRKATAFIDTNLRDDLNGAPDLQLHIIPASTNQCGYSVIPNRSG